MYKWDYKYVMIKSFKKEDVQEKVDILLEMGSKRGKRFKIDKTDDGIIYSKVVDIPRNKCDVSYYEFGKVKEIRHIDKFGRTRGKEFKWYENGQKELEGTYKDGKQIGKWTYYNFDGSIDDDWGDEDDW